MADDESTKTTEDTGISEEVETSMDDDTALEDIEVTFDDQEDEAEEKVAEVAAETTEPEQSEEADVTEPEESTEQSEEQSEQEDTKDTESERKRFNDEMAKRRIAEREARLQAKQAQETLEKERLDRYLAEAEDDDALYAQRQTEIERFQLSKEKAAITAEKLEVGIDKAITTIDMFRTGTQVQKDALLESLDEFEQMYVVKEQKGNLLEVKANVTEFLQKKADTIKRLTQSGAATEAKTKQQVKARTVAPPSRAPKQAKADPDLEAFDEMANRW
jgi:hypothetical protein